MSDRRGVWQSIHINSIGLKMGFCSVCGFYKEVDNYCGHCGAQMDSPVPVPKPKPKAEPETPAFNPETCGGWPADPEMRGCHRLTERLCITKGKCNFYSLRQEECPAKCKNTPTEKLFPQQAELLRVFAANGMSVRETVRELNTTQNSLHLRFERIREKTGLDPKTLDGLQELLQLQELTSPANGMLTERQVEIFRLYLANNRESTRTASQLGITKDAINKALSAIFNKTGFNPRTEDGARAILELIGG